jgi:hypothetical protein
MMKRLVGPKDSKYEAKQLEKLAWRGLQNLARWLDLVI